MSQKCQRPACGKTVFHAEKKEHDGMLFHARCFNLWKKEEEEALRTKKNAENYEPIPDVAPQYYRVADAASGLDARMQSGLSERTSLPAQSGGAAPKFCPECGANTQGGTFCGECGHKW